MKTEMPWETAWPIACEVRARIAPYCERIEIAGSLRRHKPMVGDIDLVVIPKTIERRDLFDAILGMDSLLDPCLVGLGTLTKDGPRYKQIELPQGIHLELWIVLPPSQWGVVIALRTGPADYGHWLVTPRRYRGGMPSNLKMHDCGLYEGSRLIETPTEESFFAAIGLPLPEPWDRIGGPTEPEAHELEVVL